MVERRFPILWQWHLRAEHDEAVRLGCPRSLPWSLFEGHERQAQRNHGQTLERLAERGGLCPKEAIAVLTDRHWRETIHMPLGDAIAELKAMAAEAEQRAPEAG